MKPGLPNAHIRGEHTYVRPPSVVFRSLAVLSDLTISWVVLCLIAAFLGGRPLPSWQTLLAYGVTAAVLWLGFRGLGQATPGERLWDIRVVGARLFKATLRQSHPLHNTQLAIGTFGTAVALMGAAFATFESVALNPLGIRAEGVDWEVFLPDLNPTSLSGDRFTVIPMYYALGAWPHIYRGNEVFYNFPYEKGPPVRFAGETQARWNMPETRVTFEGPKTPYHPGTKTPYARGQVDGCIEEFWSSPVQAIACLPVREAVLGRHFAAFHDLRYGNLKLDWVRVANHSIPEEQQVQGFYLSASDTTRGQDRFVMVTAKGTEQSFILDYPISSEGEHAREVFQDAIRSLRVSDDLNPGRVWIDEAIERVKLDEFNDPAMTKAADGAAGRLAEIQAMLLARISVDPKMYESYYHLGGTALMLARHAAIVKMHATDSTRADRAAEWLKVAKPLIESAWKYANDLAPQDKRTAQLHDFLLEAQKL